MGSRFEERERMSAVPRFGIGGTPVPAGPPPAHARRHFPASGPGGLTRSSGQMWTPIQMPSIEASAGYGAKGSQGLNPNSQADSPVMLKPRAVLRSVRATTIVAEK